MTETPHWLTPEEQRAWRGFVRMNAILLDRLAQVQAAAGLSGADYVVLVELTDRPEGRVRFQELARAVEWEKSRMSHHIARMAKRGLVVRETCAEDGRGAVIAITPAGREAIERAAPSHVATVRRLFIDLLTPAELVVLTHVSERVLERMERESDGASGADGG
ncbi:MarR family transcriptional regulator [Nocardiopsis sp. RSe5-2]|uniref:MarR family transcriptional regulator n=1 Tax=Nocardiopsis endophytica TaxID=3018445 RepID=A0ABT4U0P6_9ACTN|nr:MarR family transcriptional regulator [Nocardiopsis endophytica]MDA2810513.1 MarR family transcriptional regulator [Nocardiopsis endophytica]